MWLLTLSFIIFSNGRNSETSGFYSAGTCVTNNISPRTPQLIYKDHQPYLSLDLRSSSRQESGSTSKMTKVFNARWGIMGIIIPCVYNNTNNLLTTVDRSYRPDR